MGAIGNTPRSIAYGDVNNDGMPDMLVGASKNIYLRLNNGNGTFGDLITFANHHTGGTTTQLSYSTDARFADINNDGNLDIIGISPVRFLLGNGDGTFESATSYSHITGRRTGGNGDTLSTGTMRFVTGDINDDGIQDVVFPTDAGIAAILGNGDGSFNLSAEYLVNGEAFSVALADFDGDGYQEAVSANHGTNDVQIIEWGYGNGTEVPHFTNTPSRQQPHMQ